MEKDKKVSFSRGVITLSDVATPDNKEYRRKTWSHGWKCTVSHRATPYDFGLGNRKMFLFDHLYYLFSTIFFSVLCIIHSQIR